MVTDLRQALRDTAGDPPAGGLDHAAVIRAGRSRLRRRRQLTVAGAVVAVLVTTLAVLLSGPSRSPGGCSRRHRSG